MVVAYLPDCRWVDRPFSGRNGIFGCKDRMISPIDKMEVLKCLLFFWNLVNSAIAVLYFQATVWGETAKCEQREWRRMCPRWDVWIQRPAVCSVVRKILEIARSFVSCGVWHILWNCSETRLSWNDGRGEWLNIRDGWWFWGERCIKLGIWPVYFVVKAIFFKKNALLFGIYGKSL